MQLEKMENAKIGMMTMDSIKTKIDSQLHDMKLPENFAMQVMGSEVAKKKVRKHFIVLPVAVLLGIFLLGMTVGAGYIIHHALRVNDQVMPELDAMTIHRYQGIEGLQKDKLEGPPLFTKSYTSYETLRENIGLPLLDTIYTKNNDKMLIELSTDKKDYITVNIEGFIVGDTKNLKLTENEKSYYYDSGNEFHTPVSLLINVIISEEQSASGFEHDFLGGYNFVEQYMSRQGYKVNIVEKGEGVRTAIFVADGVRYTLSGGIKLDKMKEIIDSME